MVDEGAASASFGKISYYFGTNIPGKPRRYLLNSGGRPKLFKEIATSRWTTPPTGDRGVPASRPVDRGDRRERRADRSGQPQRGER